MEIQFFNREVENPVLKLIIAVGAAVFAAALVAAVLIILIPVLGAIVTGVLLIVAVTLLLVLIFVPFFSFIGLVFSRRKKGSGKPETMVVNLEPFDSLKVSGAFTVNILCGEEQQVKLTTDDNLLDSVDFSVSAGELAIRHREHVSPRTGTVIDVSLDQLKKLKLYGAASVTLKEVASEVLDVRASGAAALHADGSVHQFRCRISGAGKIRAAGLEANEVDLRISGAGKADVYADSRLAVRISGAGRVRCGGNPENVEKHISGAGKVEMV